MKFYWRKSLLNIKLFYGNNTIPPLLFIAPDSYKILLIFLFENISGFAGFSTRAN